MLVGGIAIAASLPSVAHADAAGPTDYRSEIVSIEPAAVADGAIDVSIEGGDSFVRIEVQPGHDALVLGYETDPGPEPYLRIDADGRVFRNVLSYATYYNSDRYGGGDIPDIVDNAAEPEWEQVGDGGSWAWHDHRAHYMGTTKPIGMEPGDAFAIAEVPLVVDGTPVTVEVRTVLQEDPSWWPALLGLLIGLQLVLLTALAGPATTVMAAVVLSTAALVVGLAEYRSLPPETGPLVTWWLLPAMGLVAAVATIAIYGRSILLQRGLVAFSGLVLALWAYRRRSGLTAAVLPTDLPFWLDRMITAGALAGGLALTALALRSLFTTPAAADATS
jgi:hypothetical protein